MEEYMTENTATTDVSEEPITATTEDGQEPIRVSENSSFKNLDALIKGKREADEFIVKLKAENAALFEKVKELTNLNNFNKEIKTMTEEAALEANNSNVTTNPLTVEDIQAIAVKALEAKQDELKRSEALKKANDALTSMYGSEAQIKKENKAKELGITVAQLDKMCEESPKVFNKLMGIEEPTYVSFNSLNSSRISTATQETSNVDSRVERLMTDPNFAKDSKAISQLIDDAMKNPSILSPISQWKTLVK